MGCAPSKAMQQDVAVTQQQNAGAMSTATARKQQPEIVPGRSATTVSETTTAKGSAESLRQVAAAVIGSTTTTNGIHHHSTTTTPNAHIHHASQVASDPMLEADAARHGSVVLQQQQRRSPVVADPREWKVRPGYSSGASSFCSEDDSGAFDADVTTGVGGGIVNDLEGLVIGKEYLSTSVSTGNLSNSKHSYMLDTIRQEIAAEEDIAPKVVRIETPFGKPIEEIYQGVHDGPVLGSGVSGIVRLVTHRATGVKYAVKCLDIGLIDSMEGLRQLRNEIFIMCQLDHPNIVRIEEVYESTNEIYILQELCLGGDLFDRLDEQPDYHYTEAQCARLVKQMLSAVRYLHSRGIIHRDLKLENFLFSSNKPDSELKMIDFGLSKHFELGQSHHEKVGTPYTVAPEIIQGSYNEKSDVWAIGVIAYLLLSGETPFGGLDGENLLVVKQSILRAQVLFEPPEIWDHVSREGKAFVKRLLQADPNRRPTAKELQRDEWIQVWAKKDVKEGNRLNPKTLKSLVAFKEQSDLQKLLSEVLSFTLLPDQIAELKKEFELIDTEGDGEISLVALKKVLRENAEAGMLGALTENEIEDIFGAIKTRKNELTIRWHEFLAAGLSQARVDDRNLRLAFDRLDTSRRGYITFDDLQNLLGSSADDLEKMWKESLEQCKMDCMVDRINFEDFKKIMKGQPKEQQQYVRSRGSIGSASELKLTPLIEGREHSERNWKSESLINPEDLEDVEENYVRYKKTKSRSHEQKTGMVWDESAPTPTPVGLLTSTHTPTPTPIGLPSRASTTFATKKLDQFKTLDEIESEEIGLDGKISPLVANRALYRRNRGMRLAVLEASKQFDKMRNERYSKDAPVQAGLIMKRGAKPPAELEDAHSRALFDAAAKRCGRSRRTRNKTVSDVTGMLIKANV